MNNGKYKQQLTTVQEIPYNNGKKKKENFSKYLL